MSNTSSKTPTIIGAASLVGLLGILVGLAKCGLDFFDDIDRVEKAKARGGIIASLSFDDLYPAPAFEHLDNVTVVSGAREGESVDGGEAKKVPTFTFTITYLTPSHIAPCSGPGETDCVPASVRVMRSTIDQSIAPEIAKHYQGFIGAFAQKHCKRTEGGEWQPPCPKDARQLGATTLAWTPCAGEKLGAGPAPKTLCLTGEVVGLVAADGKPAQTQQPTRAIFPLSSTDAAAFRTIMEDRLIAKPATDAVDGGIP